MQFSVVKVSITLLITKQFKNIILKLGEYVTKG